MLGGGRADQRIARDMLAYAVLAEHVVGSREYLSHTCKQLRIDYCLCVHLYAITATESCTLFTHSHTRICNNELFILQIVDDNNNNSLRLNIYMASIVQNLFYTSLT